MVHLILVCSACQTEFAAEAKAWRCAKCKRFLKLRPRTPFTSKAIIEDDHSLWRYRAMLPVNSDTRIVTMGEGMTPLVEATFAEQQIHFKLEYVSPTGSFKDRGTTVLVTKLLEWGIKNAGDDSSGNAGASLAAYCAHAGIAADIFTPSSASPTKLAQIEIFGATLWKIDGPREAATTEIEEAVEAGKMTYATHAWSPFVYEGTKTVAYEIWEQLGRRAPDWFVSPVGQGSLFLGAYRGFKDLLAAGEISHMPRMLAVQSDRCAPIVEAITLNLMTHAEIEKRQSIAEGIALAHPIHDREILEAVRKTGGNAIAISDEDVESAQHLLAETGFYVEPTSAVVGAALEKLRPQGIVVAALTGSGMKSPIRPRSPRPVAT